MESVVKNLLDPLFLPGMICFTFNDLETTLRNSCHFYVRDVIVKDVVNSCHRLEYSWQINI